MNRGRIDLFFDALTSSLYDLYRYIRISIAALETAAHSFTSRISKTYHRSRPALVRRICIL